MNVLVLLVHHTLSKLRFAVGLVGEKAESGGWKTSFHDSAGFEPVYDLVFAPSLIIEAKRQTPAWVSRLKQDGWQMNYWPERVREKCKADKSLAIAHGLAPLYVEPPPKPTAKRGRKAKEV